MADAILSVAEMRAWEARTWAAGINPADVIQRAGRAVAAVARGWTRPGDPVLVLAGQGHNGDDAAVAARELQSDRVVCLVRLPGTDGFRGAKEWLALRRGSPRALVIDGMFGIGLNRPLAGDWADLVEAVNAAALRVLAVDVPSGLEADSGAARGPTIEAAVTVTLGAVKAGLVVESAAPSVGRLELARDIGLLGQGPQPAGAWWTTAEEFDGYPPRRPAGGHKGSFGHVAILAGSLGYHGAAVLAAGGALRARPGLVTVFTEVRSYLAVASQLRSAMVRPWAGELLGAGGHTAVVIGPGLASPGLPVALREEACRAWVQAQVPVVADASALDWLPVELDPGAGLRVVTPHPGEAARLLGVTPAEIQADRIRAAARLGARWGPARVVVVLKGRHTVVGLGATGPWFLNSSGNPGLAQGGSGDVLAGLLGGLLAQPALAADALRAVRHGVWWHGAAADRLEARGGAWTTDDLAPALGWPSDPAAEDAARDSG